MSSPNPNTNALVGRTIQLAAPADADAAYYLPRVESGRMFGILLRRGWIVVVLAMLGALALFFISTKMPKTFRASGSVIVSSQAPVILDIRAVAPQESRDLDQLRSVEQGLTATTLLMRLIETNHLADDQTFAPKGASQEALLQILASRLTVQLSRGTRIIDIQIDDTDPVRARNLVQSLVDEYEKWTDERQKAITLKASEGLALEEKRLRQRMELSALSLQEFRKTHPIPGMEGADGGTPVRDSLSTLSAQLTVATATRLRLESEFEAYVKFDSSNPDALAGVQTSERGTEVLAQVRGIQQKEADFTRIKERYLFKHPLYKESANQIALMKSNLADTVRAAGQSLEQSYRVAKENELKLSREVATARDQAVDVEGVREKFRSMSRESEADRTLHDSVALRLRETGMMASVSSSILQWQGTPLIPEKAHSPRKIIFAAVGGFVGLIAGTMLLVGLELADRKVRDAGVAARVTGAPLLVSLPRIDRIGDGMVILSDPASGGAEAFRRLRAVLAPSPGATNARTVLFASANAGEGKSFCALNYATSLAMQGYRTLLLDADLRRAGLSANHLTGVPMDLGLGGFLDGAISPADACFTTALPNLYLLSSGPIRSDASELLAGTRFPSLLEDAYRWFDRVVIDTSPILPSSDMLSIVRYADRTCLVVRHSGSDRSELKRAADLVRSAGGSLVGFVWNETADSSAGGPNTGPGVSLNRPNIGHSQSVAVSGNRSSSLITTPPTFA